MDTLFVGVRALSYLQYLNPFNGKIETKSIYQRAKAPTFSFTLCTKYIIGVSYDVRRSTFKGVTTSRLWTEFMNNTWIWSHIVLKVLTSLNAMLLDVRSREDSELPCLDMRGRTTMWLAVYLRRITCFTPKRTTLAPLCTLGIVFMSFFHQEREHQGARYTHESCAT